MSQNSTSEGIEAGHINFYIQVYGKYTTLEGIELTEEIKNPYPEGSEDADKWFWGECQGQEDASRS